jgi:hypothetical protein
MIFIPPAQKFVDDTRQVLYQYNINQDPASQKIIDVMHELSREQKQLVVTQSEFHNLNFGRVLHSLGSLNPSNNKFAQSKGIVCSINDFEGRIEFINNTLTKNMVFIPSAITSNSQKYNKTILSPPLSNFRSKANAGLEHRAGAYLEFASNDTGQLTLNGLEGHQRAPMRDIHFFNYLDMEEWHAELRDNYTTQSTIFLKHVGAEHVIIENNTFDSNIGIHGGAIHIDYAEQLHDEGH